jgi:Carboxypeptidase regulatory-like domain
LVLRLNMTCHVIVLAVFMLELITLTHARAQAPTGDISGRVMDPTGAAIPRAQVVIENKENGLNRTLATGAEGNFHAPALPPGNYRLTALAPGFQRIVSDAVVEAGTTTTVDLAIQIGPSSESVTVEGATPQIRHDAYQISGVTTGSQIDGLPLNGRDFLELAKLEPGALQPTRGSNNRTFVPLLTTPAGGNNGRGTRVTVDGGSIIQIGNGGTAMGFSQEVVQEFQVSTANFDLSTGMTASGSINVATRSGSNQWHGSAFYFFRDDDLSAYPALKRNAFNPDPFFQRQQYGIAVGGPIRKDRLFIFGTFERNDQLGVVSTELLTPEFAPLGRITPSPTYINLFSVRLDWLINGKNSSFLRQSHENGFSFAPTTLNGVGALAYPSAWTRQPEWADQSILGLTSQLGTNWVNDLRFSYFFVSSREQAPTNADCPGCLGIGAPAINVPDLYIGTSTTTAVLGRRYQLTDVVAWQKGTHSVRFGGDWETTRGGRTDTDDQPVTMNLFSPEEVQDFNNLQPPSGQLPLPSSFQTISDILQLPLQNFTVGIGDPQVPQVGFGNTRIAYLLHLFAQDTWHLRPELTVIYGLGWNFDTPLNYDLSKPAYLAPVLGATNLGPTQKNWKNFSPAAGFSWSPWNDGKTVIRGGAGIYYDFQTAFAISDAERVSLGPRGVARGSYDGGGIANPLTDVPGVPEGTLLNFFSPTAFTGQSLLEALPTIRADLSTQRGNPTNRDFSVRNIEVDKQGSIVDRYMPDASSEHVSIGVQREIARDFVISADFVYRQFDHIGGSYPGLIDVNHYFSTRGPVLPICATDAERNDPKALCSLGPIYLTTGIGGGTYRGLLVRAEKRFSHGWQLLGSYAYSSSEGNGFNTGFNNDDPLSNYGPLNTDYRHILSVSGLVQLPKQFQLGFFITYVSRPPFSVFLSGLDFNGDGTTDDLLPGSKVNEFNRGLGKADLQRLVNDFNQNYAGKVDAHGTPIPLVTLPAHFEFGDPLVTQDLRLSRTFSLRERLQLEMIGEVFNLLNIANLSGRSGDLLSPGFGQPRSRVTQVFGSGGPRAFQLAARISF